MAYHQEEGQLQRSRPKGLGARDGAPNHEKTHGTPRNGAFLIGGEVRTARNCRGWCGCRHGAPFGEGFMFKRPVAQEQLMLLTCLMHAIDHEASFPDVTRF